MRIWNFRDDYLQRGWAFREYYTERLRLQRRLHREVETSETITQRGWDFREVETSETNTHRRWDSETITKRRRDFRDDYTERLRLRDFLQRRWDSETITREIDTSETITQRGWDFREVDTSKTNTKRRWDFRDDYTE